jgi:hypothetical protein
MPYVENAGIPHVGDRVRHLTGNVGTVIFVQRDAPKTQAREHIRVRWDNDSIGVAPHLANEYTRVSPQEQETRVRLLPTSKLIYSVDLSLRSEMAAPGMVREMAIERWRKANRQL